MKENKLQPRLLHPARISFKYEGEIKSFTDKQKLREFSIIKPAIQQMLKIFSRQETQKTNIKSSKGKTTNNTQGDSHKDNCRSFNRNSLGQEGMARHT